MKGHRWSLIGGGLLVALLVLAAIFADEITAVSPHYWDAKRSILDGTPPFPPGPGHPLGTDEWGRDIWSRVVYGTRWSLFFAVLVMIVRMLIALPAAFIGAYGPRRAGWLLDRLYVMTNAIPPLVIYLLLLSHPGLRIIGLWPSVVLTVTVLALVEWPRVAVVLKGRIDQLSAEPFVEGAVAVGGSRWHIFRTHLLPHLWPTLLHLMAAEIARALLVMAQMGLFGILFGGGVLVVVDNGRGGDRWIQTTGLPEWGSLLSEGRPYILSRPWIPFPPAAAFLIAVTGFTMLSQGLEGFNLSMSRIKERTTGRLSPRWRLALAALPALSLLWYYQGLPWDRVAGIHALVSRQAASLSSADLDGYLRTYAPGNDIVRADARLFATALTGTPVDSVDVALRDIRLRGARAEALLTLTAGNGDQLAKRISKPVSLFRRWGSWYMEEQALRVLRGYHVDVTAAFDPLDPAAEVAALRQQVYYLATAADHAYAQVLDVLPETVPESRPDIRLYESDSAFRLLVGGVAPPEVRAWYSPGEPIRLSPEYLRGQMRWETERTLGYEFIKYLSYRAFQQTTIDPVAMGRYEISTSGDQAYRPDIRKLAGTPLMDLADLFATSVQALGPVEQRVFAAESAELVRFLQERLPAEELRGPAPGECWSLASLSERLGQAPAALAADYEAFLQQQLRSTSDLTVPAALEWIPKGLPDAIARRAEAAEGGDVPSFLSWTAGAHRADWMEWLTAARQSGLTQHDALLLSWDRNEGVAWVLERLQFSDGRIISGVVPQSWTQEDGSWVVGPVVSPFQI